MYLSLNGTEPGLVCYYRLDEGAGTDVADATGLGHDGTIAGAPMWLGPAVLTCEPWDGTGGGVLAFLAHDITLGSNSLISADGKGYRGGTGVPSAGAYEFGIAGERTTGASIGRETDTLERPQGGGGASQGAAASGGGGGYGSSGTDGQPGSDGSLAGEGATHFGTSALSRLYPGGGGGGSGSHGQGRVGVGGGAGGGIVLVAASSIGGSGVYIIGHATNSWQVAATGGAGGLRHPSSTLGSDGGTGGVGRIRFDLPPEASVPAADPAGHVVQSPGEISIRWSDYDDTDSDGLSDLREYELDMNPTDPDTDGDTLPDWWEVEYGLDPLDPGDAAAGQDADGDGVENLLELRRGTRPDLPDTDGDGLSDSEELFEYHTDPLESDTDGDGVSDGDEVWVEGTDPLFEGSRYFYDSLDRLVGVQHEDGLGLGYEYDGNYNILRQVYTLRDANTNSLPDVWEFIHGLTNDTGGFVDSDGDGWSDFEEARADTHPADAASMPNLGGEAGAILATLEWPFTPSNFVIGVGQLDGIGAEEIVIGADGDTGASTNFLWVLSQSSSGWSMDQVDIGPFGVTSVAIGQPANRAASAVYLGLRQVGGTGSVVEMVPTGGQWVTNTVALSTNEEAHVLGVRPGNDVLVSLGGTNEPPGCPYYASFASGWNVVPANARTSRRGLGTLTEPGWHGVPSRGLRLLDTGGIEVVGHDGSVPTNAVWNADYGRWFFLTPSSLTWESAQDYADNSFGGNLATVDDETLNMWLWNQFKSIGDFFWIGLRRESLSPISGPWVWASGAPVTYTNWRAGEPNNPTVEPVAAVYPSDGTWNNLPLSSERRGAVEVAGVEGRSIQVDEPTASGRLVWRGHSLNTGDLRLTNAVSILYAFADDINMNSVIDAGDEYVLAEYLFTGATVSLNDLQRVPLDGSSLAQSYGLACVDVLYGNAQILVTAEPDGRIFCWTAATTSPALQRQLFSAHHRGMGWHALSGVKTLEAGESLAGLRVDPAAPAHCDVILWPPLQQLPVLSDVPQTAPVTQILPSPNQGGDIAAVHIRIWDAEGSPSRPELEYQSPGTGVWSQATVAAVDDAPWGFVETSPSGLTHSLSWDAARDLGPGFTNTVALRARAHDARLTGDWSPSVSYTVGTSQANNPRAYPDSASTDQGLPVDIDVLANDTVENSAPKLIAQLGTPGHGSASTNVNMTVRYTPEPDFVGVDDFIYWLTDNAGAYSVASVTVTVESGTAVHFWLTEPGIYEGGRFGMTMFGTPGTVCRVQASTNLVTWSDVGTVTNVTGNVFFLEQAPLTEPCRCYRLVLEP